MFGFNLGGQEIALVGVAVLLLFGAKRLPEVFRSLGQGIAEFRRASREVLRELEDERPSSSPQRQSPHAAAEGEEGRAEPKEVPAAAGERETEK